MQAPVPGETPSFEAFESQTKGKQFITFEYLEQITSNVGVGSGLRTRGKECPLLDVRTSLQYLKNTTLGIKYGAPRTTRTERPCMTDQRNYEDWPLTFLDEVLASIIKQNFLTSFTLGATSVQIRTSMTDVLHEPKVSHQTLMPDINARQIKRNRFVSNFG